MAGRPAGRREFAGSRRSPFSAVGALYGIHGQSAGDRFAAGMLLT